MFVRDRHTHVTVQVPFPASSQPDPSLTSGGNPFISGDGRYVAYTEREFLNDVPPDSFNYSWRVYVYDRQIGTLERADVASDGTSGVGTDEQAQAISDDGRDVMFLSGDHLVPDATDGDNEYVRDRVQHLTYLVNRNASEEISNNYSGYGADISGDGSRVAFTSQATNLVGGDTNGALDVFVRAFPGAPPPPPPTTTTTQPRIPKMHFVPACTTDEQYAVDFRVENFPVAELRTNLVVTYADNTTFTGGFWFTPDATGAAVVPDVIPNATQPYSFDIDTFVDQNHNGVLDSNEFDVGGGFTLISQPCASPTP